MDTKRNITVDIMKGIGIFIVVLGHVSQNKVLNTWIYSFHMPLFFFISGITCNMSSQKKIYKKEI